MMYKQTKTIEGQTRNDQIHRISDDACIPFDPANTDYQTFKKDLSEGASLKDAEGNDMTAEQITAFLETLT